MAALQRCCYGSAPGGPQAPATRRRSSSMFSLRAELGRAPPTTARRPELSRTQPNAAEPGRTPRRSRRRRPSAAERARERASSPGRGGEAPPQGEEVPARRRPPAAEAARVAPWRERPAEAARRRGRAGGVDFAPARSRRPPPAGSRASVGAEHPAAPDLPAGAHRAQLRLRTAAGHLHCLGIIACTNRTPSLESWPSQSFISAWALSLKQLCYLHWSEGAARHGGSHLPGGSYCHRLQRPRRLLAAAALGHSLLGLPFSLHRRRFSL